MARHALLSASSAHRWMHCPPSARLTEQMKDEGSTYAREGTLAHSIAEARLRAHMMREPFQLAPHLKEDPLFYEGMVEDTDAYVSYVLEAFHRAGAGAQLLIEQQVDFTAYVPDGFGTADAVLLNPAEQALEVVDLKFGKGVPVSAFKNPQLMLYGLGALLAYEFIYPIDEVWVTVVQPRLSEHADSYALPATELKAWAEAQVKPAADLAYHGKGRPCAGPWCRWCKIKGSCRVRAANATASYDRHAGQTLTPEETGALLERADEIAAWVKDLQETALSMLLTGAEIPGWKVVAGRSNRKITDPDSLAAALLDTYAAEQIYKPQELQTLTALEKLVGKKAFAESYGAYIDKPPGKPTLAPEADKRPAMVGIEAEFTFD